VNGDREHGSWQGRCPCLRLRFDHTVPRHKTAAATIAAEQKIAGEETMPIASVSRRVFVKTSTAAASWLALSPAIIGRAQAATLKLKCSSSLPNDPKYANGRVYYDNLVKSLKANGLGEQIDVTFFPDNQLGQEVDVINSVKLGVIDLMVSGSSISAISLRAFRSRPRRSRAALPSPSRTLCSRAPTCASSPGPIISAHAACWRRSR